MIKLALAAIPGGGPILAGLSTAWSILSSPIGRTVILAAAAFIGGWQAKAHLDEAATARAVITKQRIDLAAAERKQANDAATIDALLATEAFNQERIRDLTSKPGACIADDAAARGLRGLR